MTPEPKKAAAEATAAPPSTNKSILQNFFASLVAAQEEYLERANQMVREERARRQGRS
jgi:hypothetical protein